MLPVSLFHPQWVLGYVTTNIILSDAVAKADIRDSGNGGNIRASAKRHDGDATMIAGGDEDDDNSRHYVGDSITADDQEY